MNLLWLILFKNLQFASYFMSCLWSFQNLWPELLCISAIKNSAVDFKFVKNIFILINVFLFLYSFSLFIWTNHSKKVHGVQELIYLTKISRNIDKWKLVYILIQKLLYRGGKICTILERIWASLLTMYNFRLN